MKIRIGEWVFDIENYNENGVVYSKLTEEKLYSFTIVLNVDNMNCDEFEDVFEAYKNGNIIVSEPKFDINEKKYSARIQCSSTSNISHYKNYTIELNECESKTISGIEFEGITFKPYEISQEISQDAVIIDAKVIVTSKQFCLINKLKYECEEIYFPVKRIGISDTPMQMRFGRNLWSKTDDTIKMSLILVEEAYDEDNEKFWKSAEPELSIAIKQLQQLKAVNTRLLGVLVDNNLITEEQKTSIQKELSVEELRKEQYLFDYVKDVDDWR